MKILLIEDNLSISKGLEYTFNELNYEIINKTNLKEASMYLIDNIPSLIILDISLPDGDGFSFYENIIKKLNIKTIILTAKDDEDDIVKGLELGANDYITKPFNLDVLLLRIKKLINLDSDNELELVKEQRAVRKNGRLIELTKKEYLILEYFFSNPNIILTRDQILNRVWGIDYFGDDRVVDTNIKRIRRKIDENKKYIKTASGTGYIFVK